MDIPRSFHFNHVLMVALVAMAACDAVAGTDERQPEQKPTTGMRFTDAFKPNEAESSSREDFLNDLDRILEESERRLQRDHDQSMQRLADLAAAERERKAEAQTSEVGFKRLGNFYVVMGLEFEADDPEVILAIASFPRLPRVEHPPGVYPLSIDQVTRREKWLQSNPDGAESMDSARVRRPAAQIALYQVDGRQFTSDEIAKRLEIDRATAVARLIMVASTGHALTWAALEATAPFRVPRP
ncbi:MAG: hypothetical protein O9256_00675 [Rhizobiaceae bacterium]|nr:hypothetical protein [Rhizobiaceae bacterium]